MPQYTISSAQELSQFHLKNNYIQTQTKMVIESKIICIRN